METIYQALFATTEEYQNTLRKITPSRYNLSQDGKPIFPHLRFSEANLVSSYLRNYQALLPKGQCTIWQEYPFHEDNKTHSGHIDGFIIDQTNKALIFIEAKRMDKESKLAIGKENTRHNSLVEDYNRIAKDLEDRHNSKLLTLLNNEDLRDWNIYIVLLVDAINQGWASKSGFIDKFENKDTNRLYKAIGNETNYWRIDVSPKIIVPIGKGKTIEYFQGYIAYKISNK